MGIANSIPREMLYHVPDEAQHAGEAGTDAQAVTSHTLY